MSTALALSRDGRGQGSYLLRVIVAVSAALPVMGVLFLDSPIPLTTRAQAALLWVLCLAPSWAYLVRPRQQRAPIPFVQLIGVLYGMYYALLPALGLHNQYDRINLQPAIDYAEPVELALLGWLALGLGYIATGLVAPSRKLRLHRQLSVDVMRTWGVVLLYGGIVIDLARSSSAFPAALGGLLQFVSMLTYFGAGLLLILLVEKRLSGRGKMLFFAGIAAAVVVRLATGSMANVAYFGIFLALCVWIARGDLPFKTVLAAAVLMVSLVTLRGLAGEYRRQVWFSGESVSAAGGAGLMLDLLVKQAESQGVGQVVLTGFETTIGRSANTDLFADVIRSTPDQIPFWNGNTYLSLVGLAVPRFLWPDKPTKELGQAFGHRYGYLHPNDTSTSINFPYLIEFYANFGEWGVFFGMILVGLIYRLLEKLVNNPGQNRLVSVTGLVLLLPLFNIESDFSLTFGGLLLNGVALIAILKLLQRMSHSAAQHPVRTASPWLPAVRAGSPIQR